MLTILGVFAHDRHPAGELHRIAQWQTDRRFRPLGVAPFLFPTLHDIWPKQTEFLLKVFRVESIQILFADRALWDKPFDEWTNEDRRNAGHSALWEITTGNVLWSEGGCSVDEIRRSGRPAAKLFNSSPKG